MEAWAVGRAHDDDTRAAVSSDAAGFSSPGPRPVQSTSALIAGCRGPPFGP